MRFQSERGAEGQTWELLLSDDGNHQMNDRNVYSGNQYYGVSKGGSNYPSYDMVRIAPDGESYYKKIHTDPPTADTRVQTGAGDPAQTLTNICLSGATTLAVCGGEVDLVDASILVCLPYSGCGYRVHMFSVTYDGPASNGMCNPGDSGAPFYVKDDPGDGAKIRGMEIGGNNAGTLCVGHLWSAIRDHLDVTIDT